MHNNSNPTHDILYRPGRTEDWPQVAPIVEQTWGGEDYITETLWQHWAEERTGRLVVAERDGQVIGLAKITRLGPAEWWLEGLRVAPEHRRQGIAHGLTAHLIEWFEKYGDGMLRLALFSENEASKKLAYAFGMRHTASYRKMVAPAKAGDYRNFRLLQPQNIDMIDRYLRRSPMYRVNRFVELDWTLYYLTSDRLASYLQSDYVQVLGWRQFGELHGLAIVFLRSLDARLSYDENSLQIGAVYAPDDTTLQAMLRALRGLAAYRGHEVAAWKMPVGVGLERATQYAGFEPEWDDDGALWLFERPLRL